MTAPSIDSTAAAEHFFAGAVAAGMAHVVVSPGSRSTPLAVAADRTPGLTAHVHLDERCAAFAALGHAKSAGTAVGLVCTSGTAAANYLPAIAEASMSNVALVAITADRPPEHQHVGAGQSFDQRGLFGPHVRDEITMPVGPDGGPNFSQRTGWRAVATAVEHHGPVHVNWAFRLPLEPVHPPIDPPVPLPSVNRPSQNPEPTHIEAFNELLTRSERPLIIAGPDAVDPNNATDVERLLNASETLGIPVLADVLSGLRGTDARSLIDAPALVIEGGVSEPDLLIRLGQTPTAKSTRLWWESLSIPHVLIDPIDDWNDPSSVMTSRIRCSGSLLLEAAASANSAMLSSNEWVDDWIGRGQRANTICTEALTSWATITEAHIASMIGHHSPAESAIVASSSMPIRDLDTFTSVRRPGVVISNRGINGIDGVVSTSIGVSRSHNGARPVVYIGDVAALHDIGGILDAARQGVDLTVVIPNNDGGGIFSFLPAKEALEPATFTSLLHSPHGTNFEFLGGQAGIHYEQVSTGTAADVGAAIEASFLRPGVSLVEIPVSTDDRLEFRDALRELLQAS